MAEKTDVAAAMLLKAAGAATAAAASLPTLQGAPAIQKVRAANEQVQFGIIGSGSRGTYLMKHLKTIDHRRRCVASGRVPARRRVGRPGGLLAAGW